MRSEVKRPSTDPPREDRLGEVVEYANRLRTRYGLSEEDYRDLLGMLIMIWLEQMIEARFESRMANWTHRLDRAMDRYVERIMQ